MTSTPQAWDVILRKYYPEHWVALRWDAFVGSWKSLALAVNGKWS